MAHQTLELKNYLQAGQAYHYARVVLAPEPPQRWHDHDFHELFWLFAGSAEHHVNGEKFHLEAGTMLFIRPSDTHGLWKHGDQRAIGVNVALPTACVEAMGIRFPGELGGRYFWSKASTPYAITARDYPERLMRDQIARLARAPRTGLALEGFLAALFSGLHDDSAPDGDDMPAWLTDLCHKAREPELFKQGTGALIAISGRSHSYVCRAFEQHLGKSPTAYLTKVRMRHAARRLLETQDPIAVIAEDCGLQNISHFYTMFAREHALTPAAFRRQRRKDPTRPLP
ncbi:MAG: AraC family transcriptional regulator [Pseudomonadota bacterium]